MSVHHFYSCNGPDCTVSQVTDGYAEPEVWVVVTDRGTDETTDFCSWDCVYRYAAPRTTTRIAS